MAYRAFKRFFNQESDEEEDVKAAEVDPPVDLEAATAQKREWLESRQPVDELQLMAWPQHLFEHFFVVGLPPDTEVTKMTEDILTRDRKQHRDDRSDAGGGVTAGSGRDSFTLGSVAFDRPPAPAYEPQVLYSFPAGTTPPLSHKEIAGLCFPHHVAPSLLRRSPSFSSLHEVIYSRKTASGDHAFIFALKVGSALPLFGVCCYVEEMVHLPPFLVRPAFPSCNAPYRACMMSAPRCYCLLSHYAFFHLHYQVLHVILGMERLHRTVDFSREATSHASPPSSASQLTTPLAADGQINHHNDHKHSIPNDDHLIRQTHAPNHDNHNNLMVQTQASNYDNRHHNNETIAAQTHAPRGSTSSSVPAVNGGTAGQQDGGMLVPCGEAGGAASQHPAQQAASALQSAGHGCDATVGMTPGTEDESATSCAAGPAHPLPDARLAHTTAGNVMTVTAPAGVSIGEVQSPLLSVGAPADADARAVVQLRQNEEGRRTSAAVADNLSSEHPHQAPVTSPGAAEGWWESQLPASAAAIFRKASLPIAPKPVQPLYRHTPPLTGRSPSPTLRWTGSVWKAVSAAGGGGAAVEKLGNGLSRLRALGLTGGSTAVAATSDGNAAVGSPGVMNVGATFSSGSLQATMPFVDRREEYSRRTGPSLSDGGGVASTADNRAPASASATLPSPNQLADMAAAEKGDSCVLRDGPVPPGLPAVASSIAAHRPPLPPSAFALAYLADGSGTPSGPDGGDASVFGRPSMFDNTSTSFHTALSSPATTTGDYCDAATAALGDSWQRDEAGCPASRAKASSAYCLATVHEATSGGGTTSGIDLTSSGLQPPPSMSGLQPPSSLSGLQPPPLSSGRPPLPASSHVLHSRNGASSQVVAHTSSAGHVQQAVAPPPVELSGASASAPALSSGISALPRQAADGVLHTVAAPGTAPGARAVEGELQAVQFSPQAVLQTVYSTAMVQPGEQLVLDFDGISSVTFVRRPLARRFTVVGTHAAVSGYAEAELAENVQTWTIAALARALSLENILMLLSALLLERQVVVFCPAIGTLSAIVLSLMPLLRPYVWQSLSMPVTPSTMLGFLEAPVPFVLGVQYKTADVAAKCQSLVRVNVYKDQVRNGGSALPPLPGARKLHARLAGHYGRMRDGSITADRPLHLLTQAEEDGALGFLSELQSYLSSSLVGDLRPHVITNVGMAKRTGFLMRESLLEGVASKDRPFVRAFMDTQMFAVYSDAVIAAQGG